jgi:hypothetical protein
MQEGAARATLTLAAAKAALQKWQGHMRRGAQLQSETEYAAALALVPQLPQPAVYQARTLRALADLYHATGRLDEAASVFERVTQGGGRLSEIFWRDYARLLFQLGLKRLGAGQVALANEALVQASQLLERPDLAQATGSGAGDEARLAALSGYAETALWFERAGEIVPAALYGEKFLDLAVRLKAWPEAGLWLRRLGASASQRAGAQRALVWLDRLQALQALGYPEALAQATAAACQLAQAEMSLGRAAGADALYARTEAWLKDAGPESLALADLYLSWGLAFSGAKGRPYLEQALSLRRRLLGPQHPRTREAEQALGGLPGAQAAASSDGQPQAWDGGGRFQGEEPAVAAEAKRLHRRLARLCHPDGAQDPAEAQRRHQWMVKINAAAAAGDVLSLRLLMREVLAALAQARKTEEAEEDGNP